MSLVAKAQAAVQSGLQAAVAAALAAALAPYHAAARWVSLWTGLLLQALSWVGVAPAGYVAQARVKELNGIIEHMHRREDSYRQALRELQDAMEAQEGDKKKALRALKKTRLELDLLSEELAQMQASSPAGARGTAAAGVARGEAPLSCVGLHWSVGLLAAAVYWFYMQDFPAIQRKLVFTLLSPLAWFYLTTAVLQQRSWCRLQLYLGCWFVLGFVTAHKFAC